MGNRLNIPVLSKAMGWGDGVSEARGLLVFRFTMRLASSQMR